MAEQHRTPIAEAILADAGNLMTWPEVRDDLAAGDFRS